MAEPLPDGRVTEKVNRRSLFLGVAGAAALTYGLLRTRAAEAAMAVIDSGAIAQLASQLNELKRQYEQLMAIKKTADDTLSSIGRSGPAIRPRTPWQSNQSSVLRNLLPDFNGYKLPKTGGTPTFSTVNQSADFFRELLFEPPKSANAKKNEGYQMADVQARRDNRDKALADASRNGLALAAHAKSTVPALSAEAEALFNADSEAADLRGQVAVTNRALAAMLQEQAMTRALLASILENIATENARKVPMTWGGGVDSQGGAG